MPVPHSTYLVSFVIGKYIRVEDKYKDIPLGFYVYPGKEVTAAKAFGNTKDMIGVYERLTGVAFPYNKYDQTVVSDFKLGGMESITATTMADTEIFFVDFDFGKSIVTDLVSHELAHSWFGDLVTCRNWAELWLNEGFATYMEAAYREQAFGREDYLRKIRSDAAEFLIDDSITRKRHGLYNLRASDVNALFDNSSVTYHKGGAVIHTLREQIGTEAFWKAINIYLNRHKFANVESTDLKRAMEEASGQNLAWFFDQWVYSSGAPRLAVTQAYSPRLRNLTVTVIQTQVPDAVTPAVFRLPLDLTIHTAAGGTAQKMDVIKRTQIFTFKTNGRPKNIEIGKDEKIPLKRLKIRPMIFVR
ncbi:MAG: M1 family aminopeptidase [Pyrinomonadaceae bacterium]